MLVRYDATVSSGCLQRSASYKSTHTSMLYVFVYACSGNLSGTTHTFHTLGTWTRNRCLGNGFLCSSSTIFTTALNCYFAQIFRFIIFFFFLFLFFFVRLPHLTLAFTQSSSMEITGVCSLLLSPSGLLHTHTHTLHSSRRIASSVSVEPNSATRCICIASKVNHFGWD